MFSIAALNASMAALAGLVAALRRGQGLSPLDLFRLREIVEFSFANVLLAVSVVPLATITGSTETAARAVGMAAMVYLTVHMAILIRRQRLEQIVTYRSWAALVIPLLVAAYLAALATVASGAVGWLEVLLVVMLARPMTAFLFVLSMFGTSRVDGQDTTR